MCLVYEATASGKFANLNMQKNLESAAMSQRFETFFMLNLTEHEFYTSQNLRNFYGFLKNLYY